MLDILTNLMWIIVGISACFVVVYSLVRLAAIAWHRTKAEFDTLPYVDEKYPERKRPNDEEL